MHWSDYAVSPSQRHQKHWWKFALAQHCCSGRQIQMEVLHSNADEQHYHWGRSENYVTGYMLQPALSLNSSKVAEYSASMTTTAATSHTTSIQQNILGSKTNSQVTLYKQMHFPNSLFMLHTRFQKKDRRWKNARMVHGNKMTILNGTMERCYALWSRKCFIICMNSTYSGFC